ncbi:hypothetical protein LTR09_012785 [Extremus antarcticus]|uniref:Uncharacterized protein n=1 Tax=Extremus antarcticus TaxID=702011 RepID=A0AAJ0D4N9_9PEZI|nr:hypothetical protein LTR09_012785 [Extremus antarcticus]
MEDTNHSMVHYAAQGAIGEGFSEEDLADASKFIEDAEIADVWKRHPEKVVPFEMLEKVDWATKVSAWVDNWVAREQNIERASTHVGRAPERGGPALVRSFCMFRLKAFTTATWLPVSEGLGRDADKRQTVVFVALIDLDTTNGFFMSLKKGQDVCVDSRAIVYFPPTGGGSGLFFCLNL